jgi:Ser/Thr protein kinase RdoA (MazF antagonist)
MSEGAPFADLTPDAVLEAAEAIGLAPDGHLFALNSYENRVYRLGRFDQAPVVVKFYRAGRWSDDQILEEHDFALELTGAELPVSAPLTLAGATLHHHRNFRLAAFTLCPGRAPDLDSPDARELLGRTVARIHAVGQRRGFQQRPTLRDSSRAADARAALMISPLFPEHMRARYAQVSAELIADIQAAFMQAGPLNLIRLHGDCHLGNILWQVQGPLFVDLDDCMNGPRIQDLWMFLAGSAHEQQRQWLDIMQGYQQFAALDPSELHLIEALRATRMLHHAAWIADRWRDPAFPRAFPWAAEARFWEGFVGDLYEQRELLAQSPLLNP